jgi:hypothetical protein
MLLADRRGVGAALALAQALDALRFLGEFTRRTAERNADAVARPRRKGRHLAARSGGRLPSAPLGSAMQPRSRDRDPGSGAHARLPKME